MLACVTDTDYIKPYLKNVEDSLGIGQPRWERGLQEEGDGWESTEDKAEATSDIQSNGKEELADCSVQGLQGREHNQSETQQTSGCGYRLRFAPPTIDDDIGWAHTLAHMPEIEPSFCRVVNGLPNGMEQRLRTLGNAVVPTMAAKGFTELVKKLQTSK